MERRGRVLSGAPGPARHGVVQSVSWTARRPAALLELLAMEPPHSDQPRARPSLSLSLTTKPSPMDAVGFPARPSDAHGTVTV